MRRLISCVALLMFAVAALTLIADEPAPARGPIDDLPVTATPEYLPDGRMAITGPTTITEPGSYVVTRNIRWNETIITITADNVDLDLNGFTLEIYLEAEGFQTISASGNNIRIHNGTVRRTPGGSGYFPKSVVIVGDGAVVENCRLNGELRIDGWYYRISDNSVNSPSFMTTAIEAGSRGTVRGNIVWGALESMGISVSDYVQVIDNQVTGIDYGIAVGSYGRVASNVVQGYRVPIYVGGDGNLIVENTVSPNEEGILIVGAYNHIEGNVISGPGALSPPWPQACIGITGDDNVYRRNTCRGAVNPGFVDEGIGNTSHGDNYMPNQM